MKKSFLLISSVKRVLLLLFLLMIPHSMCSRPFDHLNQLDRHVDNDYHGETGGKDSAKTYHDRTEEIQIVDTITKSAGSRLPDCSHACGSCMPCRLVIVGSACAFLTEAESCPISYRCMCNNKTYPVP